MRGVYKRALPSAASTVGYIPSRVDLFSIPFFFDYIYTARSAIYTIWNKRLLMNENTIQNIICRTGPAALLHIGDVFSWRNHFGAASLYFVGLLSGCECWWLQSVKGPVNRAGVSIHRPCNMYVVYTVKELSTIYIGVESVGCSRSEHH